MLPCPICVLPSEGKALPAVRVSLSTSSNQLNLAVDPTPQQLAFWLILDPVKLTAIGLGERECSWNGAVLRGARASSNSSLPG